MPKVTLIDANGTSETLEAENGQSLMSAAVANGVEGIVGMCGGALMCASCHVFVTEEWQDAVGSPSESEDLMLESTVCARQPNSRLSCQITLHDGLDGLIVQLPDEQN